MKTLLDGLFDNSVDVMSDRLGIDAQAFFKDFDNMEKLIIKDDNGMTKKTAAGFNPGG